MRFFFMLSLLLATMPLWGQVKISSKHFKVIDASQHKWSPGVVQKNSEPAGGVIYEIKIKMKKNGVKVDQFITENKSLKIEINKGAERHAGGPFRKGDQLTIVARSESSSPVGENWAAAIATKNKTGWLGYSFDGKNYLAGVSQINQKSAAQMSQ